MPEQLKLSQEVRADVARQVADWLSPGRSFYALEAESQLGDSLKVMLLTPEAVRGSFGSLEKRLIDTGQWHHQIFTGALARAYARSVPETGNVQGKHAVVGVARSDLPQALEDSFAEAQAGLPDNTETRLVIAPGYQLTALWLTAPDVDDVIVSSAPEDLGRISPGKRMSSDAFIGMLAEAEPIPGLGPPRTPLAGT